MGQRGRDEAEEVRVLVRGREEDVMQWFPVWKHNADCYARQLY